MCVTAELKMDVLREREVKDSLERQLQDEQKVRGEYKSTRVYLVEIARGGVSFYETSNRDGQLTQVYKWHPIRSASLALTVLRKLTWPTSNALKGRERAIRDTR